MSLTPEQLAFRMTGLSASDIGAVAGLSPYATPLDVYLVKRGLLTVEENGAMRMGHVLEPVIAGLYEADLAPGESIAMPAAVWPESVHGTVRHASRPWVLASPDRVVLRDGAVDRLVEIKTVSARMAHHWGEAADDVPAGYRAQVEWQMEATGIPSADLVAWVNGWNGPEVRTYRFERDPQLAAMLLAIGDRFWRGVREGREPAVDGSESWSEYLAKKFPRALRTIEPATSTEDEIAREFLSLLVESKRIESRLDELKNRLCATIGDREGVEGSGWRATWKTDKAGKPAWKTIATALGAEARPDIIDANTAPPGRRFLLNPVKAKP